MWGWGEWSTSENGVMTREHTSGVAVVVRDASQRFIALAHPAWEYIVFTPGDAVWRKGFMTKAQHSVDDVRSCAMYHGGYAVDAYVPVQGPLCEGCKGESRDSGLNGCVGDWAGRVHHSRVLCYID